MTKQFNIKVNGKAYIVEVEELASPAGAAQPAEAGSGVANFQPRVVQGAITAPMPGMITKIACKKGDAVEAGQVLMVLEAMKMENEITAPQKGIVQEVRVSDGQTVAPGDMLAVIA
ncbi:MAG: biotin/lipoyl-binding protein [Peptococcaceae bacterium]|nr:biotin/lipoyl-binding protein [Peptococcaceae bacterium]